MPKEQGNDIEAYYTLHDGMTNTPQKLRRATASKFSRQEQVAKIVLADCGCEEAFP